MADEGQEELSPSPIEGGAKPEIEKPSLRERLVARLDSWSERIRETRQTYLARQEEMETKAFKAGRTLTRPWRRESDPEFFRNFATALYVNVKGIFPPTNPIAVAGSMYIAEKTTVFLRDHLKPKSPALKSQEITNEP